MGFFCWVFFPFSFRNEIFSTTDLLYLPGFALLCLPALGEMLDTLEQAESLFAASPGLTNIAVPCSSWGRSARMSPRRQESFIPASTISHGLCSRQSPQGCWRRVGLPSIPHQSRAASSALLWRPFIYTSHSVSTPACKREGEVWIHIPASLHFSGIRKVSLLAPTKDILKAARSL